MSPIAPLIVPHFGEKRIGGPEEELLNRLESARGGKLSNGDIRAMMGPNGAEFVQIVETVPIMPAAKPKTIQVVHKILQLAQTIARYGQKLDMRVNL